MNGDRYNDQSGWDKNDWMTSVKFNAKFLRAWCLLSAWRINESTID